MLLHAMGMVNMASEVPVWQQFCLLYNMVATVKFYNLTVNPLTPLSDQERISPYNINKISTR